MIKNSTAATTPPPPYLLGVLRSLYRWRKQILVVTLAGTLLAVVISLLLPVYYLSKTSFLAVNPDQNTPDGIFGNENGRISVYGNRDDIDRLLAVAESNELVDYMVGAFDLYTVYDIDSTGNKASLKVSLEFLDNYEVAKTPKSIIELSVMDKDPRRAAEMARAAREHVNAMSIAIASSSQLRTVESLRGEIENREMTLEAITDTLEMMRTTSGIYNLGVQSEALSSLTTSITGELAVTEARIEAYQERGGRGAQDSIAKLQISLAGLKKSRIILDSQLTKLNLSIAPITRYEEDRGRLSGIVSYDRLRLKQYETLFRGDRRALEVVEDARVPVVKEKPARSVIVLVGLLGSFLAAVIGVLLIESSRRYDWAQVVK